MVKQLEALVRETQKCGLHNQYMNKTKSLTINSENNDPFPVNRITIGRVNGFTYFGGIISTKGGTGTDIQYRTRSSTNIWKTKLCMVLRTTIVTSKAAHFQHQC